MSVIYHGYALLSSFAAIDREPRGKSVHSQYPGYESSTHDTRHAAQSPRPVCTLYKQRQLLPGVSRQQSDWGGPDIRRCQSGKEI